MANNEYQVKKRKPRSKFTKCSMVNLRRSSRIAEIKKRLEEAKNGSTVVTQSKSKAQSQLSQKESSDDALTMSQLYFKLKKKCPKNKEFKDYITTQSCSQNTKSSVALMEKTSNTLLIFDGYNYSFDGPTTSKCLNNMFFGTDKDDESTLSDFLSKDKISSSKSFINHLNESTSSTECCYECCSNSVV